MASDATLTTNYDVSHAMLKTFLYGAEIWTIKSRWSKKDDRCPGNVDLSEDAAYTVDGQSD